MWAAPAPASAAPAPASAAPAPMCTPAKPQPHLPCGAIDRPAHRFARKRNANTSPTAKRRNARGRVRAYGLCRSHRKSTLLSFHTAASAAVHRGSAPVGAHALALPRLRPRTAPLTIACSTRAERPPAAACGLHRRRRRLHRRRCARLQNRNHNSHAEPSIAQLTDPPASAMHRPLQNAATPGAACEHMGCADLTGRVHC